MGSQSVTGWAVGCGSEASATDCRKAKTEHGKKPNTVGELGSLPPAAPAHLSSLSPLPVVTASSHTGQILGSYFTYSDKS